MNRYDQLTQDDEQADYFRHEYNMAAHKISQLQAEIAALKDKLGLCECDNKVLRLKESERNAALKAELGKWERKHDDADLQAMKEQARDTSLATKIAYINALEHHLQHACTERDGYRNGQMQMQDINAKLIDANNALKAELKTEKQRTIVIKSIIRENEDFERRIKIIKEVYERFKHLDKLLSAKELYQAMPPQRRAGATG